MWRGNERERGRERGEVGKEGGREGGREKRSERGEVGKERERGREGESHSFLEGAATCSHTREQLTAATPKKEMAKNDDYSIF